VLYNLILIYPVEDWLMDDREHYDDLGGAYYYADDKESFEARTPKKGGCGCVSASIFVFVILGVIGTSIFF
jgi:hypothetical protein